MKTHNETLLGFFSLQDFFNTLLGLKYKTSILCFSVLGGLIGLLENWIYPDSKFIFMLLALVFCDFGTAVIRSIKNKTFTSKRMPRFLGIILSYCLIISLGWHLSERQEIFSFLPGFLFGGFYMVLFISIFENLVELGLLPGEILIQLKDKFLTKKKTGE